MKWGERSGKMGQALFLFFCILFIFVDVCIAEESSPIARDIKNIKNDYENFYLSGDNLFALGAGIAGAGILANTSFDREVQKSYQKNIRGGTTDTVSQIARVPGDVFIAAPLLLGAYLAGSDHPVGLWAQKSLRAMTVGIPSALIIGSATGASRPAEGDSKWSRPFERDAGLSKHAFIGAVPFITAAKMTDEQYAKFILYGLSVLPGLSRINDNKHYFSQAALGWYLAYLSCNAVDKTDVKKGLRFGIIPATNGGLLTVSGTF